MPNDLHVLVAAIRAQPWAIMPEYLEAIEALALRALDADILERVASDGHEARLAASREAVAATGTPLQGARMSTTVRNGTAVVPMVGVISPRMSLAQASTGGTDLASIMHDLRVAWAAPDIERVFVDDVAAGRGVSAARVRADFGQGAMVDAAGAVSAGMADRIGTREGVLAKDSDKRRNYGAGRRARATAEIETRRRAAN